MRIVLVSQYVSALRGMARICRRGGHLSVAAVCTRAESPTSGLSDPRMVALSKAIVGSCPPGLSVNVVDGMGPLCDVIERYSPDLLLVRGFPWRLPARALQAPRFGAMNLHPSSLPEFRGPFPVDWALRRGDSELGFTAHRMDAGFDTGRVLATVRFPVGPDEFGGAVWARVDAAAERVLVPALDRVFANDPGEDQDESQASYAGAFDVADGVVDWTRSALEIHHQVRAWSLGSQGAEGPRADLDGSPVRILRTSLTAIDAPRVSCGDAPIWLADFTRLPPETTPGTERTERKVSVK
jgi:methionyl-tRNA formyltransferase